MKITSYIWQGLITLTLIFTSIWVYDRYFNSPTIIQAPQANFKRVSLSEKRMNRINGLTDFRRAAAISKSSVVYITSFEKLESSNFQQEYKIEKGSGVIISSDGDIVTNHHVITNADFIQITLEDKREFTAEVIGTDESTDLALLKIEAQGLPHLLFSNSDSLEVGEWILAIGNPFGLQSTVTAGIVSAKARNIDVLDKNDIESFIQSDAVINPGSSGGALVSSTGELMGICTAIISKSGNYEGLSFAIPSNLARKVIVDLKEFGAVQRGKIGITISDVDNEISKKVSLPFIKGVFINTINLNSAAAASGLKRNDVITAIDERAVNSSSEFNEELNKYRPGDVIKVDYYRDSKKRSTQITLRNYLNTTDFITVRNDKVLRDLGIEIRNLNSIEKSRVKTDGVMIISVNKGSIVDDTNMEPGYIVEYFNDNRITNVQEFMAMLKSSENLVQLRGFYERYPDVYPYSFYIKD